MALKPRHVKFIEELLADPAMNASAAYRKAGFKGAHADSHSYHLKNRPGVKAEIERRLAERAKKYEITAEMVLRELARVAFSDLRRCVDADGRLLGLEQMGEDTRRAVAAIEVQEIGPVEVVKKVKLWDKLAALEKLGKHLGMFVEKKELTISGLEEFMRGLNGE